MVSHSFRCDPSRLKLLLHDRLPEQSHAEVARHIETCQSCRQRLESLAAEARWWNDVRQFLGPERSGEAPTVEGEAGERGSISAPRGAQAAANVPPSLGFLAPSGDPERLGRLGPYEIVEVIGSGGMGVVLKGFDGTLNRYVAVKVLSPPLAASAAARRRFAREAQAAAAIVHEHVVPIHAVASAEGLPYLVMPFVPGRSLQERIHRTGPLEVKEILRIGMQAASGLAAAHAQGLVHRDVKPANILLENGVERVLITDFGLARAVDDASLTQSGVLAGTPQYMAPEQAKGETVDHRADLFSLGSVIYAMCTGHSPFRAETTMGVLRRICECRPRPIRQTNPEIPDWLVEIVEKLHQKDPNDRFQSGAEVADLLGRHLAHLQHPSAVPRPQRLKGRRAWTPWTRVLKGPPAIVAVLLLLIAGLGVTEMLRITNVAGFVTGVLPRRGPESAPAAPPPAATPAPPAEPEPPQTVLKMVPSDLLHWDDGLQPAIHQVDEQLGTIEAQASHQDQEVQSPDGPQMIDLRLRELEQELNDRWP